MKIGIPKNGRFGEFGGKYIPETLAPAIEELEKQESNRYHQLMEKREQINVDDISAITYNYKRSLER